MALTPSLDDCLKCDLANLEFPLFVGWGQFSQLSSLDQPFGNITLTVH